MAIVIVDGHEIEIGDDERLNGIEAAARIGIDIPHYCWHPGLSVVASCRMCLVETGRRDPDSGKISLLPKLVPACQTPATDGTVFVTNSDKVAQARAMVEEDLLLRHPVDCPICDKAGECRLQDYHFEHGRSERRAEIKPFTSRRRDLGEKVTLFVDRCVMCSRCVRFAREIAGTGELMISKRGAKEEIDVFPGFPLNNELSGNVVDLCPVGALGDRDFLYRQRVWFLRSRDHVCAGCSQGCSIHVDQRQDRVYRLRPRENAQINRWWMCDEGRYGWHHIHDPRRLAQPARHGGQSPCSWKSLIAELEDRLRGSQRVAAVLSPHLTVEEAYLMGRYFREIDADALLGIGPVPVTGEDTRFPGGFVIRAEKCPNRRGVEAVVAKLAGRVLSWDEWLEEVAKGPPEAIWISGGYKKNWNDEAVAGRLDGVPLRIVQDLFSSPLMQGAHYQLPGAAFAEREGSYVNANDILQSFAWAVRPPESVMTEGQLFWRLLGREGLYQAEQVREEIAREIPFFAAAIGPVPAHGVDLKSNRLAGAM